MTRFLPEQIPVGIQTIEQLIVWGGEILQNGYPDQTVIINLDEDGNEVKARDVEASKFYWTAPDPAEWRYSARFEIKLSPNHQVYGRIWDHAQPLGNFDIPAQMKRPVP